MSEPFHRTLAPLLRNLDRGLRRWLDESRRFPVPPVRRAEIEGIAVDLKRKADAIDVDRPHLVIVLMGGTGVGKSTLMNALAGGNVAVAALTRPTTRDPVVYFHHTVPATALDPALKLCKLVQHERPELLHKVIVDTPDLDSNDVANRERLFAVLPVADIVLYVGSQEKYHDRVGWDLFRAQRRRRAFAFVLNKWDRCQEPAAGLRPDEDLLADLKREGFADAKLFRTTAQAWVDAGPENTPADLPPGEQFAELRDWLELGLTRLEIDAIKARGVGQLLDSTRESLAAVKPPDLADAAAKTAKAWGPLLDHEAQTQAEALVGSLDPYQAEVEAHFAARGQQRFRGLMAGYLRLTTNIRYGAAGLRGKVPFAGKSPAVKPKPGDADLHALGSTAARSAGEKMLAQRVAALANKLVVEADQKGLPVSVVNGRVKSAQKRDWEDRATRAVSEALRECEAEVAQPTGWRRVFRGAVGALGNLVPEAVLIGSILILLWRFFVEGETPALSAVLLPVLATLGTLVVLQVLITLAFPVSWPSIRSETLERLRPKLAADFRAEFGPIPGEIAADVKAEADAVDKLVAETGEVAAWLAEREEAARLAGLYGS